MQREGLLLILFLSLSICNALNYVFDEYLFSKDTWIDWKVENPLAGINPSDLLPKAKESFPGYDQAEFNSLDGTNPRLPPSQKILSFGGGLDLDPLDEENFLEPAAKAAQCTTCHVLIGVVWSRLTASVLSGVNIRASVVRGHLVDACEKDALEAMLQKYSILKMDTGSGPTTLTFFVVRERRDAGGDQKTSGIGGGSGPTEAEEEAVERSCKNLITDYGADLTSVVMTQLANYRREALRLLVKHGRDGGSVAEEPLPAAATEDGSGSGGSGSRGQLPRLDLNERVPSLDQGIGEDEDDDYVDPDDLDDKGNVSERKGAKEKPAADGKKATKAAGSKQSAGLRAVRGLVVMANAEASECEDLNAMCATWAASGECTNNPMYMVGTEKHRGQCRKSCGVCGPADVLSDAPDLLSELNALSAALLLAVKNLGCGASGPCLTGVSGMAAGAGLVKQQQTPKELQPGMTEFP
ncbi:hypothetical protein Vafri_21640, partial [Volvox africanus]